MGGCHSLVANVGRSTIIAAAIAWVLGISSANHIHALVNNPFVAVMHNHFLHPLAEIHHHSPTKRR
jgi:hypothetical protein